MNLTKVISTSANSLGQRLIKVLRFGRKDIREPIQATPYGVDSNPVKDMIAVYAETDSKGSKVVVGYLNKNAIAQPGEVRLFSTDADGVEQTYIYLTNGAKIELGGNADNAVRYSKLEDAFNELKTDFNNHITAYNTHVHAGVTTGVGSSGTTTPGTQSTADISPAKVEEILTP